jgi:hypothetical protein
MQVDAFLCDSIAQADGKLYVQGAGWNVLSALRLPARHPRVGIGAVIRVPYTATNQNHSFTLHLEDEDGNRMSLGEGPDGMPGVIDGQLQVVGGEFNVGRPPQLPAGDEQLVPIALNLDGLVFTKPGMHSFVLTIDGTPLERLPLRVTQIAQVGPIPQT